MPCSPSRHVVVVAFPGVNALDVIGPLEVFATAAKLCPHAAADPPAYTTEVVARVAGPCETQSAGIALVAGRTLGGLRGGIDHLVGAGGLRISRVAGGTLGGLRGEIDTLLVAGGLGTRKALADRALVGALRRLASRVRRLGSVCTGSFVLAEAGLLDGRRATTHWQWCRTLAEIYPRVRVEADPI